ncbi:MAG: phosphoglycerate dehydrogenase, partial [Parvibaculum sedimenti]
SILGKASINIANFNLGREAAGGDAICLIEVDGDVPEAVLKEIQALPHVVQAKTLTF